MGIGSPRTLSEARAKDGHAERISRLKSARSRVAIAARNRPEPNHPTAEPADTNRPINSSPDSKHSDYADLARPKPLPSKGSTDHIGIIRRSA